MKKNDYLKLVKVVQQHDQHYYIELKPQISDYEYDQLYKKLEKFEKEYPDWVVPTSPTQRIGDPLTKGFKQLSHEIPMFSLENVYEQAEVEAFVERIRKRLEVSEIVFYVEPKMDGVAVSVLYEKGVYKRALTRGNGKKGDDITMNMKTIQTVPLQLIGSNFPDLLEIRGEVFMTRSVFDEQNKEREKIGKELWANPRNAAAGSLKLLDPREVAGRRLSSVFYGLADVDHSAIFFQNEVHEYLKKLGLPIFSIDDRSLCRSIDQVMEFAHKIERKRKHFDFDIDGIVIKVDTLNYWSILGSRRKTPRWAVAYKFSPEKAETRILNIVVQVGRSGVLTPVADLEPVFLAGSLISRATLHNENEVARKDIRKGDWVVIEKGGDVIPQIVDVDLKKRPSQTVSWRMPKKCPSCGAPVVKDQVSVRCLNHTDCEEQKIRRIIHFSSKQGVDIDHLGEKVVEQLVKKGLINCPSDLYLLTEEKLSKLDGFKEKSIHNLLFSIKKSRTPSLSRFLSAIGIRYVGEQIADILSDKVDSIENLAALSKEELLTIEGIGEKIAESIVFYFKDHRRIKEIKTLLKNGVKPQVIKKINKDSHPFYKKHFVLTGTLHHYSREEAARLIKERGGKIMNSVSANTDFLIVGEKPGSKLNKAKKLKVQLMHEDAFKKMLHTGEN